MTAQYDAFGRLSSWQIPSGTYNGFSYDPEGEITGFAVPSAPSPNNAWTLSYNVRGELASESNSSKSIIAFTSAAGHMDQNNDYQCADRGQVCDDATFVWDPRVSATLSANVDGYALFTNTYDAAGRLIPSTGGSEYGPSNQTLYSGSTGYAFGDGTVPLEDGAETHHASLGSTPMYSTHNNGGAQLDDVKVSGFGDVLPNDPTYTGLTMYDRDFMGYVGAQRNSTGTSAWTMNNLYSACDSADAENLGKATTGFKTSKLGSCSPGGMLYPFRTDGYFDGNLTFRGVRTYSSGQWTTPDAMGGGYDYAGNNPAAFSDPTGFYCWYYGTGDQNDPVSPNPGDIFLGCDNEGLAYDPYPSDNPLVFFPLMVIASVKSHAWKMQKSFGADFSCGLSASQVMKSVEISFGRFGNFSRWRGLESVTFYPPIGLRAGSSIPIVVSVVGIEEHMSIRVASMGSTSMTFSTTPGHLIYPGSITFSAQEESPGILGFNISLGGTVAQQFQFSAGGDDFENAQWNHFLGQIGALCNGK